MCLHMYFASRLVKACDINGHLTKVCGSDKYLSGHPALVIRLRWVPPRCRFSVWLPIGSNFKAIALYSDD